MALACIFLFFFFFDFLVVFGACERKEYKIKYLSLSPLDAAMPYALSGGWIRHWHLRWRDRESGGGFGCGCGGGDGLYGSMMSLVLSP